MNQELIIKNRAGTWGEVLKDYDTDSFQYTFEKNASRQIEFKAYKTSGNEDIFDMLACENLIIYEGETFIIKTSEVTFDNQVVTNNIVASHISISFQDFYIDKNVIEELNADAEETGEDGEEEISETLYTLAQYLQYAFEKQTVFTYEIIGDSYKRASVPELGGKNGIEYLQEGAELFGYVYLADNYHIKFYTAETFYKRAETPIIYSYNSDELTASMSTTDMYTIVKAKGKKKTISETKNYSPFKPKNMKLTGTYSKEGTWYTATVGGTYTKVFNCKHGSETLTWNNKRAKYGGNVDVYLDGDKIGTFSQYSKNAKTSQVIVATNLEKGEHTFKAVFRGARSGVNYNGKSPRMYLNTEKGTVLNLTAKLKNDDVYYTTYDHTSPNYKIFGHMEMPTIYSDSATTVAQLQDEITEQLNDEPTIELSTNYLGSSDDRRYIMGDDITERSLVRFVHQPLGFNVDLKVVKFTKFHPLTQKPSEIEFSNARQDILAIQTQMISRIKRANNTIANGNWNTGTNVVSSLYSDVIGSILVDD